MSKPKFNPNAGFEVMDDQPASKPKFDPTKEFEPLADDSIDTDIDSIAKKYGVDRQWLKDRQIGMGYYSKAEADKNIREGKNLEHFVNSASSSLNSVLGEGLLGGLPSHIAKKLASDEEEKALDELRATVDRRKGAVDTTTELALSVGPGAIANRAIAASKLGKAAKTGAQVGLGLEEGIRAGISESSKGKELEEAADGATTAAAFEAIPFVGKGIKAAKRLLPGTDDALPAVNKAAAKIGSLIPGGPEAEALEELFSNPSQRRAAKATDFTQKAEELLPRISQADDVLEGKVSNRLRELEDMSAEVTSKGAVGDLETFRGMTDELNAYKQDITDNSQIYGPKVTKLINDVDFILASGGPREAKAATYKLGLDQVQNTLGNETAAKAAKLRSLNARRYLDDFMKNKNYENLSAYEKEAIGTIRRTLDTNLKTAFSGKETRSQADKLFSSYKTARDDLMSPLMFREGSGQRNLDVDKLASSLKTSRAQGNRFERNITKFEDFLKQSQGELGKLKEVETLNQDLKSLRELANFGRIRETIERSGGPTSAAVRAFMQATAGAATGGTSLVLMPIVDPIGWTKVVDGLNKAGKSDLVKKITNATKAALKHSPGIVTRASLLGKDVPSEE